ncbi:MAG: ABC transporter permease [Solidesulfovibrio sp. DCME]|uniref:ABC transporter permease n=1 Tax=Solidesulfovibrio sp. DCME TaxID=3447380 RepID=UPI003D11EF43
MRDLVIAAGLAVRDFLHDRLMSLCAVLSLASILAPLLLLAGVRAGVIGALQERLRRDPAILTVLPEGSRGGYALEWIEALGNRPDVAFVIPRTRDIAAVLPLEYQTADGVRRVPADMEPTAPGDPLLVRYGAAPPSEEQAVLSASAARKLGVGAGDRIEGRLGRRRPAGGLESVTMPLTVTAVLPLEAEGRDVVFVPLPLLEDAESYRDGLAVPRRGFAGEPPSEAPRRYAGFRLYARDLASVSGLRDFFVGQGVEVITKAREIEVVRTLDKSLTLLFACIAVSAGAGFVASSTSNVLAAVRRKDKHLAMLRLLGFSGLAIRIFPIVQSLLTAGLGSLLAWGMYAAIAALIDRLFADSLAGQAVCRLPAGHLAVACGIVLALSLLSSIQASLRAARIDPSAVLREL